MAKKETRKPRRKIAVPKECYFCVEKKDPTYTDASVLQRFTSDRGKIIGRVRNGLCARHQRMLTDAIKYARHLALMPFVTQE